MDTSKSRGIARATGQPEGLMNRLGALPWRRYLYLAFVPSVLVGVMGAFPHPNKVPVTDFASFVISGRAVANGMNPYGVYPGSPYNDPGFLEPVINLNPPLVLPFFHWLAQLDDDAAFRAWYLISLFLYGAVILLIARADRRTAPPFWIVWAFSLTGLWSTLNMGQIYVPMMALAVGAWLMLRQDRWLAAGLLLGTIVAIKPNFAVWLALLVVAGHWRAAVGAAATGGLLTAIPLALYGPTVYVDWLRVLSTGYGNQADMNTSLYGLAWALRLPWLGAILSALLIGTLALWAWKRRPSAATASGLGLVASLLASPVAWPGYILVLLPWFSSRRWTRLTWGAALLMVAPIEMLFHFRSLVLLLILLDMAREAGLWRWVAGTRWVRGGEPVG